MAQLGKVLRLVVEVRSVPEGEGTGAGAVGAPDPAAVQGDEVQMLSLTPRASSAQDADTLSDTRSSGGDRDLSVSQSLPGDPASSQLRPAGCQGAETPALHRWSLPNDRIGRLLSEASLPGVRAGLTSEYKTPQGCGPQSLVAPHGAAPLTPPCRRSPCVAAAAEGGGESRRSVVTFSYIEKANVRTVQSPGAVPRQSKHPLHEFTEATPTTAHLRKRMSAPVWLYTPETPRPELPPKSLGDHRVDPTRGALGEFGSPQLKRRVGDGPGSPAEWHQQPRCQSWAGSPVPRRGTGTLPTPHPPDPDWLRPPGSLPRTTASQPTSTTLPTFRVPSQEVPHPAWGLGANGRPEDSPRSAQRVSLPPGDPHSALNQLSGTKAASPANSLDATHRLDKEATRVCTVFQEVQGTAVSETSGDVLGSDSQGLGCMSCDQQQSVPSEGGRSPDRARVEMNVPVGGTETPQVPQVWPPGGSPALPARLHRSALHPNAVASPIRDPRLQRAVLQVTYSPTLHRHQPPQYTGGGWSPGRDVWRDPGAEPAARLYGGVPDAEAPVSWTSRQQWGGVAGGGEGGSPKAGQQAGPYNTPLDQRETVLRTRQALLLGPVALDSPPEGQDCNPEESGTTLAPEHWCVPQRAREGQADDERSPNFRVDQACPSPESTLSSHRSYEAGNGVQSDSGLSSMGPSLHSQKIARAKWEFLFGTQSEDSGNASSKDASTAPPSGTSSESPTPTPPTSLPLEPASHGEGQRSGSHEVQHVEVELVTPPPAMEGASPKTGIIRRTVKYSETDLDAVPLRCYRETDIDEVLADQDEADSAFGSNRSVLGTPGTSGTGSSPLGGAPYERTDGEEEEEGEGEEGPGWASERGQGDRKRQRAAQEAEDFNLQLKRPSDGVLQCHPALKSPILVSGPRLLSEDTFSQHFESIMESHRAKGTSYCSLDSVDLLTSRGQSVLTFDLPTLTPEIQGQTYQSAREIVGLSFAPLARRETPSASEDTLAALDSDATRAPSSERLSTCSEDTPSWGWYSTLSPRERPPRAAVDSDLDRELSELLGLGSTDTLTNGSKADLEAAKRLAKRLFTRDGFRKSDVAKQLSRNNDFSRMVAEEYLHFFNFTGLPLDRALRAFLREFALMGETQERERVLSHFSRRYLQCNPSSMLSEDSVHTLTCALMLLNTDLHGHNIGKRMSCLQFMGNLEGMNDGQDFPKELLKQGHRSARPAGGPSAPRALIS
ncbi:hypothetical protein MATL_G00015410 [Megalops atlanticus]|uniref:SEC7 domain-containing protein n=1 Tax=Megalops atlanticus TaxID=7932 RepID=A0A9D3QK86_MEGAT|nr:hypothetical protein MATL_G00015410 [Megalops atlanticus]